MLGSGGLDNGKPFGQIRSPFGLVVNLVKMRAQRSRAVVPNYGAVVHIDLGPDTEEPTEPAADPRGLLVNFVTMSACFGVTHATVTASLALATTSLGPKLGNFQTALVYIFYTITALFGANSIVHRLGNKWGLCAGLLVYVAYVASFIVAVEPEELVSTTGAHSASSIKWIAASFGGSLGGIAAGFIWSAQVSAV